MRFVTSFRMHSLCLLALSFIWVQNLYAESPTITNLFPAGGQIGTEVTITLTGKPGTLPLSLGSDRPGLELLPLDPKQPQQAKIKIAASALPGLYLLRFFNAEGVSQTRPFLVGTLPEIQDKEPNDQLQQAQLLDAKGIIVNGKNAKAGDVDTYRIALKKGQTLIVEQTAHRKLYSPMDGVLQLLSPLGNVLEQADDVLGYDPRLVYTATADGEYYLRAFAFPANPNSTVRFHGAANCIYRLTVTTSSYATHASPMLSSESNQNAVELRGTNLAAELTQLKPSVIDEDGSLLHHPKLSNNLLLKRVSYPVIAEQNAKKPLAIPLAVTGTISQPAEMDAYQVKVGKGDKISFRIDARSLHSPLDAILKIRDAKGKLLREADDAGRNVFDSRLDYTFGTAGTYTIEVLNRYPHGSPAHIYNLHLLPAASDYQLSLEQDQFVFVPGKELDIPITIDRGKVAFGEEIEFKIENLPEGMTHAETVSAVKGATAKKITLKLKWDGKAGYNGPIRIVGRSKGKWNLQRHAAAKIKNLIINQSATESKTPPPVTTHLWLTAIPAAKKEQKK